ncbi:MAG: MFS transporter [Sinobacteraceae bacterium]|nr:MFS transporter [Nevskiaceae bacterium]
MTMTSTLRTGTLGRSRFLVAVVFFVFFVISFLTNILGPLVPDIIAGFHVSLTMAGILPFAFFIAYGVMSIPAGFAVQRWGEKKLMVGSFVAATCGATGFAAFPSYAVAVTSLFVIGAGMAALQVAINPLLRVAGGEEHFAFNSAFAQLIFGAASFVSPLVYSDLVRHLDPAHPDLEGIYKVLGSLTPPTLPWVSIYWIFAVVAGVCVVVIALLRLPKVERTAEESAGTLSMYRQLLRNPYVWLYSLAIVAYVGCEQGTADWMSPFLERYHHVDPHKEGADAVAYYWGLLTAGCLLGMGLLKLFDSRRVLIGFSLGALGMLSVALFGPAEVSRLAFPCIGFFASIMWPTLVSLALNSVPQHHGPFAGILCSGIMGGALVPLIIGWLGDRYGLRAGMLFLYLTFGFVLSVGLWARPLIRNATRGVANETPAATKA